MLRMLFTVAVCLAVYVGILVGNAMLFRYVLPPQFEGWSLAGQLGLSALALAAWIGVTIRRQYF